MKRARRPGPHVTMPSGFTGFLFPSEVILVEVRWYVRYGYLEELLSERGIEVDHVTLYRWVQGFTLLLIDAARPRQHLAASAVRRRDLRQGLRGLVLLLPGRRPAWPGGRRVRSQRRDIACARGFFTAALAVQGEPAEVITDRVPALANVIEELAPAALHNTGQYENN